MTRENDYTYTVDQTAELLGIGRNTAYHAIRLGQIPSIRIGRSLRVPKRALNELLSNPPNIENSEEPVILRMPPKPKIPKVPKVQMNVPISIELNNKLVQSAIDRGVSLTIEVTERLESTFK